MRRRNGAFSIGHTLGLCARQLAIAVILITGSPSLTADPSAQAGKTKRPPYMDSPLKSVPELQVRITCSLRQPTASQIVALLQQQTGVRLELDPRISKTEPALGSLAGSNVPAWIFMEQLAYSKIIRGVWERSGDGYRLVSGLPPEEQKQIAEDQTNGGTRLSGTVRSALIVGALTLMLVVLVLHWLRMRTSRAEEATTTAPPA